MKVETAKETTLKNVSLNDKGEHFTRYYKNLISRSMWYNIGYILKR